MATKNRTETENVPIERASLGRKKYDRKNEGKWESRYSVGEHQK